MTSTVAFENVSVRYSVYSAATRSLKGALINASTGGRVAAGARSGVDVVSLDGISFSATEGERIALIGPNGSGKTTILRLITGVHEPERGVVRVNGKVFALLDLGLGLDPESTGIENIYLRGLLLGLSRAEIAAKVEDIVAFADIGPFMEMPVRTYSTGMVARLAFSIATSVKPDILLIDEGIGAGDAAFIEKADRRLKEFVKSSGILFLASHSEAFIRQFCSRGLYMRHGRLVFDGPIEEAFACYNSAS